MPRHVSHALGLLAAWPRLDGLLYVTADVRDYEGHVGYPAGGGVVATYLSSISVWQLFNFALSSDERASIRDLWKHRPDLRAVLADAIGFYVCDEFQRPFLRKILAGGRGGVARWVAAYPELRQPLLEHYRGILGRFNHPFEVVSACVALTRDLGEPPDVWRAAALAIHRDDRRQSRRPPRLRSDFLRHDLETHGTIVGREGDEINRHLAELGGEPLDVMQFGYWWHPVPRPRGDILGRVAVASRALADDRWNDDDLHTYARALAALPADQLNLFLDERPELQPIADRARELAPGA